MHRLNKYDVPSSITYLKHDEEEGTESGGPVPSHAVAGPKWTLAPCPAPSHRPLLQSHCEKPPSSLYGSLLNHLEFLLTICDH